MVETWINSDGVRVCDKTERTDAPDTMTLLSMGGGYPLLIQRDAFFALPTDVPLRDRRTGRRLIPYPGEVD